MGVEEAEVQLADPGSCFRFVLSLGDPESRPPRHLSSEGRAVLRLEFDDIERSSRSCPWYIPCRWADVERIATFSAGIDGPALFHCAAGVSRSTAAGAIALSVWLGRGNEREVFERLLQVRPEAVPNRRMVWMADDLLGRDGGLIEAYRAHWTLPGEPELPPRGSL